MPAPQIAAPFVLGAQIEARAEHPEVSGRTVLLKDDRSWTYKQYRDESVRMAHFLLGRLGKIDDARPGHVAMILENHPELMFLYGGCGYAGLSLFGVNTGLRGEVLAGVLNQSRARVLVVDQRFQEDVEKVRGQLKHVAAENILYVRAGEGALADLVGADARLGPEAASLIAPGVGVTMRTTRGGAGPRPVADQMMRLESAIATWEREIP